MTPFLPTGTHTHALPSNTDALAVATPSKVRRWTSQELLQSAREVEIEHDSMVYRLRITATGKLILTK